MNKYKKRNGRIDRMISKDIREWMTPHIITDLLLSDLSYNPTDCIEPVKLFEQIKAKNRTQLKRAARYRLESRLSTDDPNSRHEKLRTLYIVYKPSVQILLSAKHLISSDERVDYNE